MQLKLNKLTRQFMEKKKIKVGYWTADEFHKRFPDFKDVPVCNNYQPGKIAKFVNVRPCVISE